MFSFVPLKPEAKVDQETLTEMVKPSIDYVRHKKFRSGNYPSSLSNETDRLVHWCHGAPGVIHMLLQAYQVSASASFRLVLQSPLFSCTLNTNLNFEFCAGVSIHVPGHMYRAQRATLGAISMFM